MTVLLEDPAAPIKPIANQRPLGVHVGNANEVAGI
jgi:hypothetical protein